MTNDELFEQAENAIDDLFSDKSVSTDESLNNMHMLQGKIQELIDALELDKDHEKDKD